jgi:transcriptional regulator with XRE-family HTH domain
MNRCCSLARGEHPQPGKTVDSERGINPLTSAPRQLALTTDWWLCWRDSDPVLSSLMRARAEHLSETITKVLRQNKNTQREPSSFTSLASLLSRNAVNLWRWRSGASDPTLSDILSLAQILGVPVGELFPASSSLVARATYLLCGTDQVSQSEAILYAEYRLSSAHPTTEAPDQKTLKEVLKLPSCASFTMKTAIPSINNVLTHLEPILDRVAQKSSEPR